MLVAHWRHASCHVCPWWPSIWRAEEATGSDKFLSAQVPRRQSFAQDLKALPSRSSFSWWLLIRSAFSTCMVASDSQTACISILPKRFLLLLLTVGIVHILAPINSGPCHRCFSLNLQRPALVHRCSSRPVNSLPILMPHVCRHLTISPDLGVLELLYNDRVIAIQSWTSAVLLDVSILIYVVPSRLPCCHYGLDSWF